MGNTLSAYSHSGVSSWSHSGLCVLNIFGRSHRQLHGRIDRGGNEPRGAATAHHLSVNDKGLFFRQTHMAVIGPVAIVFGHFQARSDAAKLTWPMAAVARSLSRCVLIVPLFLAIVLRVFPSEYPQPEGIASRLLISPLAPGPLFRAAQALANDGSYSSGTFRGLSAQ